MMYVAVEIGLTCNKCTAYTQFRATRLGWAKANARAAGWKIGPGHLNVHVLCPSCSHELGLGFSSCSHDSRPRAKK